MAIVGGVAPLAAGAPSSPTASLPEAIEGSAIPGATVEQLLAIAGKMSPDVAAAALDTQAALARVDAAGRLPDPTFATEFKDIDRQRDSALPDQLARVEYKIQQEFPLWGKLGLQEEVARARAGAVRETQRATELEVSARIASSCSPSPCAYRLCVTSARVATVPYKSFVSRQLSKAA
jgi:outer membrane protein TolC